jgi:hypothetical protein
MPFGIPEKKNMYASALIAKNGAVCSRIEEKKHRCGMRAIEGGKGRIDFDYAEELRTYRKPSPIKSSFFYLSS